MPYLTKAQWLHVPPDLTLNNSALRPHSDLCILCGSQSRSQWPRGIRCGSATARLLGLRVRIPLGAGMPVCCECCVLSGGGLCDGPITRPEESYRVWCVWVWSRNLSNEDVSAHKGRRAIKKMDLRTNNDYFPIMLQLIFLRLHN
jgi:hypothetical protein